MNVTQIEIALSQKIDSNTSNLDLLTYSKALSFLKTNGIFTASNYGNLPSAASNEGKLYFVEDLEILFWSDGADWLQLLSKSAIEFQLWSWGGNWCGTLGDGTITSRCSPVREISSSTNWSSVSAGLTFSTGLKLDGSIWSWGRGANAELGDGTAIGKCSPVREICSATDWCQVGGGFSHNNAIKTSGELWAWGFNGCGRLGDGTATGKCSPVREFCSATDWCQVSGGGAHNAAIKTTGQLWAWGQGSNGQLGDGTTVNKCSPVREICSATDWCQASAGYDHTAAIKTTGQLWAWGRGLCGALGNGTTAFLCSPVREFCSATDWCHVSAGRCTTTAVKSSGELWSWGLNDYGQLGDGTFINRCSPVREFCSATNWCYTDADLQFSAALKTDGTLWSWGFNECGKLGVGVDYPTLLRSTSPVREFCSATDWSHISLNTRNLLAIKVL